MKHYRYHLENRETFFKKKEKSDSLTVACDETCQIYLIQTGEVLWEK